MNDYFMDYVSERGKRAADMVVLRNLLDWVADPQKEGIGEVRQKVAIQMARETLEQYDAEQEAELSE